MSKKYALQIIAELGFGGAEKVARDLGLYIAPAGFETHYIVFGDAVGEYERELVQHGCKVLHWPSPSSSYPEHIRALNNLIQEYKYEVVHAHTMFNIGWAMSAAKKADVPVRIAHAHSALDDGTSLKKTIYEKTMRQFILINATHLIACGDAAGVRLFGKAAYEKSGICILNGIDTNTFAFNAEKRQAIRQSLGLENHYVIGHAGHLIEVKNQSFLIRLMPEILKAKPNAKLVLLGEGDDRPMLENLIYEMNLRDSVIMTGNVRDVPAYLSAMDVFAFPSLYEGMPLSVLEAQANGLPCVLSTGVPNDVYQTDLIQPVSLEYPDRWVQAICDSERCNPENYANELQIKGFDSEAVMKKFLKIYERADKH